MNFKDAMYKNSLEELMKITKVLELIKDEIHFNTAALDEIRKEIIHLSARQSS